MKRLASALVLAAVVGLAPQYAHAQSIGEVDKEGWTPEGFLVSFGVGSYRPNPSSQAFDLVYPSGNGPILLGEFDFFLYRIPFLGPMGIGVAGGWASYKGTGCLAGSTPGACIPSSDSAKFSLFPLNAMFVLRIDALARETPVPFVFTGKVGYNSVFFKETVGASKSSGRSPGFGWAYNHSMILRGASGVRFGMWDPPEMLQSSLEALGQQPLS